MYIHKYVDINVNMNKINMSLYIYITHKAKKLR